MSSASAEVTPVLFYYFHLGSALQVRGEGGVGELDSAHAISIFICPRQTGQAVSDGHDDVTIYFYTDTMNRERSYKK